MCARAGAWALRARASGAGNGTLLARWFAGSAPPRLAPLELELIPWCEMSSCHVSLRLCVALPAVRAERRTDAQVHAALGDCGAGAAASDSCAEGRPFDAEVARKLLSAYTHLRPFLYGQKGRCLLDSLALLEFLARDGVYPTWVGRRASAPVWIA